MGEIDAGAEDALPPILLVVDHNAAHDGDVGRSIEGCDIDGELGVREGRVVLGVEEARIDHVEMDRLAASREPGRAEIERAAGGEFGGQACAFLSRQQHRVTKMLADQRARKHVGKEQSLVDLDAVFVALEMRGLGVDLRSGRDQSRNKLRRIVGEVVEAAKDRALCGQAVVDLIDVGGEKGLARGAGDGEQRVRGPLLGLVAPGFIRQRPKESRRLGPERAKAANVGLMVFRPGRQCLRPFLHRSLGQACRPHRHRGRRRCGGRHAFGLLSMTRLALPAERSISAGASTVTSALTPMRDLISCASSLAPCARASSSSDDERAST